MYLTPTRLTDLLSASNGGEGSKFQYNFKSCPTFFVMMGPQSIVLFNADPLFQAHIVTSNDSRGIITVCLLGSFTPEGPRTRGPERSFERGIKQTFFDDRFRRARPSGTAALDEGRGFTAVGVY